LTPRWLKRLGLFKTEVEFYYLVDRAMSYASFRSQLRGGEPLPSVLKAGQFARW
jgi:hypothetical protein